MGADRKLVEFLLARLDDAFYKSRWHSFKSAVEGLTQEEASWKPPKYQSPSPWNFSGSILNLIFHLGADDLFQLNQVFGDRTLTWETLHERFKAEGGDLKAALKLTEEGYRALREKLSGLTDAQLSERHKTARGREITAERFFVMLIEHHIYHAGQINYIRGLYAGLNPAAP